MHNNAIEEPDDAISICPVEEEVAAYVGPDLTSIAAIAGLEKDTESLDLGVSSLLAAS